MLHDARGSTQRRSSEISAEVSQKGEEAKEGWFSWLNYGKSKVDDGEAALRENKNKLDSEAERLRKEAARGVANAAEDVRIKAEKRT